jgi:cytochrome c peroxidase
MGATWDMIVARLSESSDYIQKFNRQYRDGIKKENIKDALAAFERTLITPNSRFDQYLKGNAVAITELEKLGYQKFKSFGCVACHQGINIGGNMFQTMGVMGNYFKDRGTPITDSDLGRYKVTKEDNDKHVFRVPSLRNVELTAPYFHDGSAPTLDKAVGVMAKYQLGRKLSNSDIKAIVAFLKTLTGELPKSLKDVKQ